jgi:hypothetical protein
VREWVKVVLGVLALSIGASAPTLILEAVFFRSIYQAEQPRDRNIKGSNQEPSRPYTQYKTAAPASPGAEVASAQVAQTQAATSADQSKENNSNAEPGWVSYAQGLSAIAGIFVAIVIAGINFAQWAVYNRQAKILEETRKIAHAANRPFIFVGAISHNRGRFESGLDPLLEFEFDLVNYGAGPGIVNNVVAFMFLSNGPGTSHEDSYPAISFPRPRDVRILLGDRPSVRIFPPGPLNDIDPVSGAAAYALPGSTIVLPREKRSQKFTQFVRDASTPAAKLYNIWIIGTVSYDGATGGTYKTRFCLRGENDGSASEMYGPPYNERT